MHQISVLLARLLAPAAGVLLGLLGFATLGENLLGWLLFVAGILYAAGTIIVAYVTRKDVLHSGDTQADDKSFWLLTVGLAAVFFLSPLESLYLKTNTLPMNWLEVAGLCLACLGSLVFVWARRGLMASYTGHLFSTQQKPVNQGGPYRLVRHPVYLGYLLAALGLALGYRSAWGAVALLLVLVPAVLWRIHVEEQLLSARFGLPFREYAARTKRLIPGVW